MANDKGVSGKESGRGLGGGVITQKVREIEPVRPCHVKFKVMVALSLSYGFTQKSDGGIGIVRGGPFALRCHVSNPSPRTQLPLGYLNSATMTSADVWSIPFKETIALGGMTFPSTFKSLGLMENFSKGSKNLTNWYHKVIQDCTGK